jgi:hypothetical protein
VGPFNTDASAAPGWIFEESLAGTIYNFVTRSGVTEDAEAPCENCAIQQDHGLRVGGQIPLTSIILSAAARGEISDSQNREEVIAYLKRNLKWRVSTVSCHLPLRN